MVIFFRNVNQKFNVYFTCVLATFNFFGLQLLGAGLMENYVDAGGAYLMTVAFGIGLPIALTLAILTISLLKKLELKSKTHINGMIHLLHLILFISLTVFYIKIMFFMDLPA
jgi:hypothetical protein